MKNCLKCKFSQKVEKCQLCKAGYAVNEDNTGCILIDNTNEL